LNFEDEKFPGKSMFWGETFGLQMVKLENLKLAKYYREGNVSGDKKFPDKLIFWRKKFGLKMAKLENSTLALSGKENGFWNLFLPKPLNSVRIFAAVRHLTQKSVEVSDW
jgi:hypothetical protein